jgi:hypothetical protein
MEDIYGCSLRKSLLLCNLMDEIIGSMNTPMKHLNRLTQKPWRFRCTVTVEKKFPKRNQKETILRSPKPNWIGVNRNQHNNVTENRSKLKSRVKKSKN